MNLEDFQKLDNEINVTLYNKFFVKNSSSTRSKFGEL